ncbi:MAG: hypothetical protein LBE91_19455 [Tannerella sp.]|nr:hypothetical protein [Tannerella sp.]
MLYIIIITGTFISLLLFDTKVSLSGDDCDYIIAAGNFWKHFTYPGHHGALYPIVLSPFVGLFGLNLFLLKFLSTVFIVASLWFFYKSFENKIPAIVLIPALFFVCINPHVLFFASYTYSEPLFMLFQAIFFFLFSRYFWTDNPITGSIKQDWKKYLFMALVILCLGLTRTIGFSAIGVIVLYLAIQRKWKNLLYMAGAFAIVYVTFGLMKSIIWSDAAPVQSFQTLLAKNPYNTEQGMEDIPGLIKRFTDNSHIYLSGFLYKYLGFRSSSDLPAKPVPVLSWLAYILFFICIVSVFRKNKPLLFTGLYAGIMLFATFILLHKIWGQDRMIMVYYPYILLFLLGGFYWIFERKKIRKISFLFPVLLIGLLIGNLIHAKERIALNIPVLQQNIAGNDLYGLTPDWENFVKMSRWADRNLPKNAVIVSRKPSISYVYTGREFLGIFNVPFETADNVLQAYNNDKANLDYVTMDLSRGALTDLAPYMKYVIFTQNEGKFFINNREVRSAGVYAINRQMVNQDFTNWLDLDSTNYTVDFENYIKQYQNADGRSFNIISPDVLYNFLISSKVNYMLLPRIRLYTPQNTGQYVNTIHQYISFINLKYPGSFKLVHTIGKDEVCELVEFLPQQK